MSQISFKLFCVGDKRLLSELVNEVDFRDIMNVSTNILAKNQNFKKLRQGFTDGRALITMALISSCHLKTLVPFCFLKKRFVNAFLTLIMNNHKIVQKKQMLFKTTVNCLFNDICYLVIGWFD